MNIVVYLVALASSIVTLWRTTKMPILLDYSYFVENSYRIFLGQLPYKDFLLVVSPGTYFVGAWIMKLFGTAYIYQKIYIMILSFATVLLTYAILQLIKPRRFLNTALLLPLIFAGHAIYALPSYDMNTMFFVLLSIFLILRLHIRKANSIRNYFIIGIVSVIPPLFKQNSGLGFAIPAFIFLSIYIHLYEGKDKLKKYLAFGCGALFIILLFALYLVATHSLIQYLEMAFFFQLKVRNVNGVITSFFYDATRPRSLFYYTPFAIAALLIIKKRLNTTQLVSIVLYATLFSPFIYAVYLFNRYRELQSDLPFIVGYTQLYTYSIWFVLYAVFALVVIHEIIVRRQFIRKSYMSIFLIFIVLSTLSVFTVHRVERATYPIYPIFAILLLYLSIMLKQLFPKYNWNLISITISAATSFFLLVSLLNPDIVLLVSKLKRTDKSSALVKCIQNGETSDSNPGEWTGEMMRMISYTESSIPKEDSIVAIPGEDPLYYLTKRKPPLPYFQFMPETFPYPASDYVIKIDTNKIDWVIIKNHLQCNGNWAADVSYIVRKIQRNYRLETRIGGYDIYQRKP